MAVVKTKDILPKLEKVVEFVLGRDKARQHKIDIHPDNHPSTDGVEIFMDDEQKRFKDSKEAELDLANTTAHEADHIREFYELYGDRMNGLVEGKQNVVSVYCEENYGELEKNPALAGEIDNIVKDRRIDAKRGLENSRIGELQEKTFNPVYSYLRPSTKKMKPIDACREQLLQKTLLGKTNEPVRKEYAAAFDEMVKLTNSAESIQQDPEVVKKIYKIFDENFDITQPMSRLPNKNGKSGKGKGGGSGGKGRGGGGGRPQKGYSDNESDNIKPRQGRNPTDKKPKNLGDDDKKEPQPKEGDGDKSDLSNKEDRNKSYSNSGETHGIQVYVAEPSTDSSIDQKIEALSNDYGIETENMKKVFTKLQSQEKRAVRDLSGEDFDYEEYLEGELEYTMTGLKTVRKCFITETIDLPRAAWAFLSDISRSTFDYNIWREIQAAMYMIGEGVGTTQNPFALYSFASDLFVVKDFPEKYNPLVVNKLVSVKSIGIRTGTNLGPSLKVIGDLLKKQPEQQKGIIVVTDGQADDFNEAKESLKYLKDLGIHPFIILIGKQFEEYAKKLTADIGEDHYTIIERDKLHDLPEEMLRLFTKYGLAK
ncbi:VWA domain-containing protein [Candidatus Woesearchaeota archaeon]|nr:VWA domain-containing protein [Candidatus Woesearchaeota archaeon]